MIHGGVYTSHHDAELIARIQNDQWVNRYRFGTSTADFYICSRRGAVPFVVSKTDSRSSSVVNVNALKALDRNIFQKAVTDFDGETTESRLDRRERNWISSATIANA